MRSCPEAGAHRSRTVPLPLGLLQSSQSCAIAPESLGAFSQSQPVGASTTVRCGVTSVVAQKFVSPPAQFHLPPSMLISHPRPPPPAPSAAPTGAPPRRPGTAETFRVVNRAPSQSPPGEALEMQVANVLSNINDNLLLLVEAVNQQKETTQKILCALEQRQRVARAGGRRQLRDSNAETSLSGVVPRGGFSLAKSKGSPVVHSCLLHRDETVPVNERVNNLTVNSGSLFTKYKDTGTTRSETRCLSSFLTGNTLCSQATRCKHGSKCLKRRRTELHEAGLPSNSGGSDDGKASLHTAASATEETALEDVLAM